MSLERITHGHWPLVDLLNKQDSKDKYLQRFHIQKAMKGHHVTHIYTLQSIVIDIFT